MKTYRLAYEPDETEMIIYKPGFGKKVDLTAMTREETKMAEFLSRNRLRLLKVTDFKSEKNLVEIAHFLDERKYYHDSHEKGSVANVWNLHNPNLNFLFVEFQYCGLAEKVEKMFTRELFFTIPNQY